jgi:thymidylate synthase
MIHVNRVRNVNAALHDGLALLSRPGCFTEQGSRNGPVRMATGPVITETAKPMERVLFSPLRAANPFFHLFESLWMLAGRNDLPWLAQFNKQMASYSDDGGKTQPAAYGFRWREYFGYDQIDEIVDQLTADPLSRRATLAMWDPWGIHQTSEGQFALNGDLLSARDSKDVPCNTHAYFQMITDEQGTRLDMTVCCRSNDALWGAHGANAVHFSVLQEYVAAKLARTLDHDIRIGGMVQLSNNYHVYTGVLKIPAAELAMDALNHDRYSGHGGVPVSVTPMFTNLRLFEQDLPKFMEMAKPGAKSKWAELADPFLARTAVPMLRAWRYHKLADYKTAVGCTHDIQGEDWRVACNEWMARARRKHP